MFPYWWRFAQKGRIHLKLSLNLRFFTHCKGGKGPGLLIGVIQYASLLHLFVISKLKTPAHTHTHTHTDPLSLCEADWQEGRQKLNHTLRLQSATAWGERQEEERERDKVRAWELRYAALDTASLTEACLGIRWSYFRRKLSMYLKRYANSNDQRRPTLCFRMSGM